MQSSPGSLNPQAQSAASLAILALVALGLSLLLAIAAIPKPRIVTPPASHGAATAPERRFFPAPPKSTATFAPPMAPAKSSRETTLEPLLIPWAIGIDALALLGLGVVVFVRRSARA